MKGQVTVLLPVALLAQAYVTKGVASLFLLSALQANSSCRYIAHPQSSWRSFVLEPLHLGA